MKFMHATFCVSFHSSNPNCAVSNDSKSGSSLRFEDGVLANRSNGFEKSCENAEAVFLPLQVDV